MYGIKILIQEREKFEIWKFQTERENLTGVGGNIQGTEKIVPNREKFLTKCDDCTSWTKVSLYAVIFKDSTRNHRHFFYKKTFSL